MEFHRTYRGRRVFVTGDTGFKGAWLTLWLKEIGAQVMGFALPPERENDLFSLLHLDREIRHITGDLRDFDLLRNSLAEFQPEFLFHLAAQSLVRRGYREPKATFDINVGGSINLIEAARSVPSLRALVFVTSDKCYRNREWVWGYRENDELGGSDPYSASKAAAEIVFAGYQSAFLDSRPELGAASVRAGNVIGGGDWAEDRIVPDAVKALIQGEPVVLRSPASTRPWQHVLDPLFGYLSLGARLDSEPKKYSGAWNFGPSEEATRTVRDLADAMVRHWGGGEIREAQDPAAPRETRLLHLNCDKARHALGWKPRWAFDRAIEETIRWYRDYARGRDVAALSREQIRKFGETET